LDIDLLFIDEFYKLDPSREDSRFEQLNLAVYRALPKSKQIFLQGHTLTTSGSARIGREISDL
jgi:hypothetical protein